MAARRRVFLDTNLWSRIGEERTAIKFTAALRDMGCTSVSPPSMLIEVMQTPEADTRRHIVEAMSSAHGIRLRTEADLCANEFRAALQRKRPEWLRSIPDSAAVAGWRSFWTNQVWRAARKDSEKFHQHVLSRPSLAAVDDWYEMQLRNKKSMSEDGFSSNFIEFYLSCVPDQSSAVMGGWNGSPTAAGRVLIGEYYWHVLSQRHPQNDTQREWFAAYVDIGRAISVSQSFGSKSWSHATFVANGCDMQ